MLTMAENRPPVWKPVSHNIQSPMCMLFVTTFRVARGQMGRVLADAPSP